MEPHPPRSSAMHLVSNGPVLFSPLLDESLKTRFISGAESDDVHQRTGRRLHVDKVSVEFANLSRVGEYVRAVTNAVGRNGHR